MRPAPAMAEVRSGQPPATVGAPEPVEADGSGDAGPVVGVTTDDWLTSFGFSSLFDAYQCVVQNRQQVADDVQELLVEHRARVVLDCAAGTGLPALDLRARGIRVACSDGDPEMVGQFQRNAKRRGVDDQCEVRCWSQLPESGRRFDYLLCRGNSLVYAATWRGGSEVAPDRLLLQHLTSFRSVLRPGGVLHVDVPRRLDLAPCDGAVESSPTVRLQESEYEGSLHRIAVTEEVADEPSSRRWRVQMEITPERGEPVRAGFERHSSRLTADQLIPLLRNAGFDGIETRNLLSDRPSHVTVLARNPGRERPDRARSSGA